MCMCGRRGMTSEMKQNSEKRFCDIVNSLFKLTAIEPSLLHISGRDPAKLIEPIRLEAIKSLPKCEATCSR